jgi:hypothetical protein
MYGSETLGRSSLTSKMSSTKAKMDRITKFIAYLDSHCAERPMKSSPFSVPFLGTFASGNNDNLSDDSRSVDIVHHLSNATYRGCGKCDDKTLHI